jgi:hypothetical protein
MKTIRNEQNIKVNIDREKFRLLLQSEYEKRKSKNPSYSLRAFAAQLDIHASCLSVILRGKRPLTDKLINRFIDALELAPEELHQFKIDDKNVNYKILTMDTFEIISKWHYYAILELIKLKEFKASYKWIAKVLEISVTEVSSAVERLIRCELLEIRDNKWKIIEDTQIYTNDFTTSALKKLQRTVLELSSNSIDKHDISMRYHSTMMMAINTKDMKKAKSKLREFREEFCEDMQSDSRNFKDVYQLQIGFFPLTNIQSGDKK